MREVEESIGTIATRASSVEYLPSGHRPPLMRSSPLRQAANTESGPSPEACHALYSGLSATNTVPDIFSNLPLSNIKCGPSEPNTLPAAQTESGYVSCNFLLKSGLFLYSKAISSIVAISNPFGTELFASSNLTRASVICTPTLRPCVGLYRCTVSATTSPILQSIYGFIYVYFASFQAALLPSMNPQIFPLPERHISLARDKY